MTPPSGSARTYLGGRVVVVVGDITEQQVDAIVNAANGSLMGGGGVDGAIHRAGGPEILEACREIRRTQYPQGLPTGEAVATTGGRLPARLVIHTVGPVSGDEDGQEAALLASCYRRSLTLAVEQGARSVALPAVSTGIYGYPKDEAAAVASAAVSEFLAANTSLREVRFMFFSESDAEIFVRHQQFDRGAQEAGRRGV